MSSTPEGRNDAQTGLCVWNGYSLTLGDALNQLWLLELLLSWTRIIPLSPSNTLQTLSIRIAFDTAIIDKVNAHCTKPLAQVLTQQGFPRLRQASLECDIHLLKFQNAVSFDDLVGMDLSSRYEKEFMNYSPMDSLKFSCLVRVVDWCLFMPFHGTRELYTLRWKVYWWISMYNDGLIPSVSQ